MRAHKYGRDSKSKCASAPDTGGLGLDSDWRILNIIRNKITVNWVRRSEHGALITTSLCAMGFIKTLRLFCAGTKPRGPEHLILCHNSFRRLLTTYSRNRNLFTACKICSYIHMSLLFTYHCSYNNAKLLGIFLFTFHALQILSFHYEVSTQKNPNISQYSS